MAWQRLCEPEIRAFLTRNAGADVRDLALKKPPCADWPYLLILDQIKARQKAKAKSPDLYDTDGFIFPPYELFEQSSSYACAVYKASLVAGRSFIDFTAGMGRDSFAFVRKFERGVLIERNLLYSQILSHNCETLGFENLEVRCADAVDVINDMQAFDFAYIDPQRRDGARKGIFELSACSPDLSRLLPAMREKIGRVMLKTSPVLDISKTIDVLGFVSQVHVVGWRGECKEVLYLLDFEASVHRDAVQIIAVDLGDDGVPLRRFSYVIGEEAHAPVSFDTPDAYIYEPSAAFMKAGGFRSMAAFYGISKLHPSTHLYTSARIHEEFCGQYYRLLDIVNPRADQVHVKKGELVLRNFPGDVAVLRKKLKLAEGDHYRLFGTTLCDNSKKILICEKL